MSLVALIGFDHLTSGAIAGTTTLGVITQSVPRIQPDIDFLQNINGSSTQVRDLPDSRGVVRRYLCGGTNAAYTLRILYGSGTTPARTGKWLLGARFRLISGSISTAQLFACVLGVNLVGQPGGTPVTSNGTYYCEVEVDWENHSLTYYVNGEIVYSVVNDASRIDPTVATTVVQMGGLSSPGISGSWGITDIYFAVDVPGEIQPIGTRLGQIKVRRLPIDTVTNSDKFATQSGTGTIIDTLNAAIPVSTVLNTAIGGIITDPRGSLMELAYAAPNVTETIKAVQVYECGYRDQTASVGLISNIQQGTIIDSKSLIPTTVVNLQSVMDWPMTVDLNGEAWTPDKIAQLKVHVGSFRP